ncbi:MAG: thermostable hemolysin [Immundisolibacter sp.]
MHSCPTLLARARPQAEFDVCPCAEPLTRAQIEAYIARGYARCHGAHVQHFMPCLLAARRRGRWAAALGLRRADSGPLFLEQYLDTPIEAALIGADGRPARRREVAEVGNLAVSSKRGGQLLIALVIETLHADGFRWLVFTATRRVRALVQELGFPLHRLAGADPRRLGEARADWGRYYDAEPLLMAGDLALGSALLHRHPTLANLLHLHAPARQTLRGMLR